MKVDTEQLPDGEVALSFEVDDARVERAMDAAYRRVANRVDIAGFRRGKAPRQLVERMVGRESLLEEALNQLLPEVYEEAIKETNVDAVTEPEFDVESLEPLRAKATVVVRPMVTLGDYKAVSKDAPQPAISEEEIDTVLQGLRDRHAEWVPADRAAAEGDRVTMDVSGVVGDETIIDQDDVEYVIDPESKAPLPGFAEQLAGLSTGDEKSFDIEVDAESGDERLAGKTVTFKVAIKDVKAKELPELDDFFAATVGTYKDLAELKSDVEAQLRMRALISARQALEQEVLNEVVDASTLELPEKLIEYQIDRQLHNMEHDLANIGLDLERYKQIRQLSDEDLRGEMRESAQRTLRQQYTLRAIADQEELTVEDEQIDEAIRSALQSEGRDQKAIARAVKSPEIRERARASLLERRAVQWLMEQAIKEPAPDPSEEPEAEETKAHDE
jgi:trigger factor